ncbi:TOMM precursor leader peptide-binding protein [Sediminibacillus sp. JSM 1682029]|uniref:TOMM precursor leader peptide-binding protein n=1 Tax=Sediminibacillus sp. JSM 1682029 TaxID=3229857 RepID=UPI003523685C
MGEINILDNQNPFHDSIINRLREREIEYKEIENPAGQNVEQPIFAFFDHFDKDLMGEAYSESSSNTIFSFVAFFNMLVVGPLWKSKEKDGCPYCFVHRMKSKGKQNLFTVTSDKKLPTSFHDSLVSFVIDFLLQSKNLESYEEKVETFNFTSGMVKQYRFIKDEFCPVCKSISNDHQHSFNGEFKENKKKERSQYRVNPDFDIKEAFAKLYDQDVGVFNHQFREVRSKYTDAKGTEIQVTDEYTETGFGRGYNHKTIEKLSVLEAIERYCGMFDRKAPSKLFKPYRDVKDTAVNPKKFIMHEEWDRMHPAYELVEYSEDLPVYWKYGYSVKQQEKVLIPEQLVFFADKFYREKNNRFIYDSSNGMALGGTYEEAVFYGLLELIERDNFLCAFYNKLKLKEIDLKSINNSKLKQLVYFSELDGINVYIYDISMELGIPSIWAMAHNVKVDAPIVSYHAAAAHIDPEKAIETAVLEVITSVSIFEEVIPEDSEVSNRVQEIAHNPDAVTDFDDHILYYASAANTERLLSNIESPGKYAVKDIYRRQFYESDKYQNDDLKDDLEELIEDVLQYYEDIYVVDVTPESIARLGLHAAKVLVPGMLPMTFGQQHRRINRERLKQELTHRGLSEEDFVLNIQPHPFS